MSCSETKAKIENPSSDSNRVTKQALEIKYAQHFKVEYFEDYKKITVLNPWDNQKVYWEYFLMKDSNLIQDNTPSKFYIYKNLKALAVLSGPEISMLEELSLLKKVKAVSSKNYIFNPGILKSISEEIVHEVGGYDHFNAEKCFLLNIDAVITTGWSSSNQNFDQLSKVGIPIIYSLNWQENNPLGRAEWIKFIAAFFDLEQEAELYFSKVEEDYLKFKSMAKKASNTPTVINGFMQAGTWYIAGGESYLAHFFADANANYIYKERTGSGSIPLSMEAVYTEGKNADFWFISALSSGSEFLNSEDRYKMFSAYQKQQIFQYTGRTNNTGGNDYWESAIIHPEIQLRDFIRIFHPNLFETQNLYYLKKLEEN